MNWTRAKVNALDGRVKYIYTPPTEEGEPKSDFKITASIMGVEFSGSWNLNRYDKMQPYAKAVGDAWKDHRKLMPKLDATLAGH